MDEDRSFRGWLHQAKGWLLVLAAIVAAAAVWYRYHDVPPLGDAGAFAGIATHMYNGDVLYKDVFDNKAPGIFFLNLFFISITGNSPWSVHLMQLMHLAAACCCILWLWNRSGLKAWWAALFMLPWLLLRFTEWYSFYAGNYTEEYGCYYLIFAVWLASESDLNRQRWVYLIPAGAALGFAILIRETMLLPAAVVALWVLLSGERRLATLGWLVTGALIPSGLFAAYLFRHGAWTDYMTYLDFASGYAGGDHLLAHWPARMKQFTQDWQRIDSRLLWLAALSPLVWLDREFLSQTRFIPVLLPLLALSCTWAIGAGQQAFGHYFLPLIFFCLLSGISVTVWCLEKLYWICHVAGIQRLTNILLPLGGMVLFSSSSVMAYRYFIHNKFVAGSEEQERQTLRDKLKRWKTVFIDPQDAGRYYYYSGKTSGVYHPSAYYVYYQPETAGAFAGSMATAFGQSFRTARPECILTEQAFGFGIQYANLTQYIHDGYITGDSMMSAENKKYYIRVRKDKHAEWMEDRRLRR